MVHIRSSGTKRDITFRPGMTAAEALQDAGVRTPFFAKVQVGAAMVGKSHVLKDEDTITLSPKIKNG